MVYLAFVMTSGLARIGHASVITAGPLCADFVAEVR